MITTETPVVEQGRNAPPPAQEQAPALLKPLPGWILWAAWMAATLLGGLIYLAILLLQTNGAGYPDAWLVTGPGGPLLAIGVAVIAQWVLLRLYLGQVALWRWLGGSLIGLVLLYLSVSGAWGMIYHWTAVDPHEDFASFWRVVGLVVGILCGLGSGAALGYGQAWALKPYLPRRAWIWANAIAGGLIPLAAFLLLSLLEAVGGNTAVLTGESLIRQHSAYYEDSPLPLLIVASVLVIGAVGGLALARLTHARTIAPNDPATGRATAG